MKAIRTFLIITSLTLSIQIVQAQTPATASFNHPTGEFHNKAGTGSIEVIIDNTTATEKEMRELCIPYHQAINITSVDCDAGPCTVKFHVQDPQHVNLLARWLAVHAVNSIQFTDKVLTLHEFMMLSSQVK